MSKKHKAPKPPTIPGAPGATGYPFPQVSRGYPGAPGAYPGSPGGYPQYRPTGNPGASAPLYPALSGNTDNPDSRPGYPTNPGKYNHNLTKLYHKALTKIMHFRIPKCSSSRIRLSFWRTTTKLQQCDWISTRSRRSKFWPNWISNTFWPTRISTKYWYIRISTS